MCSSGFWARATFAYSVLTGPRHDEARGTMMKREKAWTCQYAYKDGYTNIFSLTWVQELKGRNGRDWKGLGLGWSGMRMGILQ